MIVISLFDGMSCGRIALERAGIKVDKYFSSEVDKHAIKVVKAKWSDTVCIGDVSKVFYKNGILHTENGNFPVKKIDMVILRSPCQGFSFAGDQLAFDDPRSKLFFEYERILNEIKADNPNVLFLLENVLMKLEHQRVITERLGVEPIEINSALLSAQNRVRLYWTNICTVPFGFFGEITSNIKQPVDKKIFLKDILQPEHEVDKKYFLSKKIIKGLFNHKARHKANNAGFGFAIGDPEGKTNSILGRYYKDGANCLIQIKNNSLFVTEANKEGFVEIKDGECVDIQHMGSKTRRGRKMEHKSNALVTIDSAFALWKNYKLRRLTPIEVCRLQNVDDHYFFHVGKQIVSDTQIYKMCGNGWTIEVIAYIFKHITL